MVLNSHVRRERSQSLVEVVHLRQDTHSSENQEHICRGVRELVVPRKGKLKSNAESLYRHNRDRPNGRADGKIDDRIVLAMHGCNLVDHVDGERDHDDSVE